MTTAVSGQLPPEHSPAHQMLAMIFGAVQGQMIRIAAELGIADLVKEGPRTLADLAGATGIQATTLARILRTLTTLELVAEIAPQQFASTPLGALLQTDTPSSLRHYARLINAEWAFQVLPQVLRSVQTGQSAFVEVFGRDLHEYLQQQPADAALFHTALTEISHQDAFALQEVYDFSTCHTVVDVGGGQGFLLSTLLQAYPSLQGILFDLPAVVGGALGVLQPYVDSGRCQVIGGSFLEAVPPGGDVYLLKRVLNERTDAEAHTLFTQLRAVIAPQGRVLVAEPDIRSRYGALFDMLMLVVFGGRLRTEAELRALFTRAGFRLTRTLDTPSTLRLIEAVPA